MWMGTRCCGIPAGCRIRMVSNELQTDNQSNKNERDFLWHSAENGMEWKWTNHRLNIMLKVKRKHTHTHTHRTDWY